MNILNNDNTRFKEHLISVCKNKAIEKNVIYKKYNEIFNKNFDVLNGIDDIYEYYTGAVYFKDYEWEEIKNNSLKDFFLIKEKDSLKYSLNLDNGVILRGAYVYYFFVSFVSRFKDNNRNDILRFRDNINLFFSDLEPYLRVYKINNYYDVRLLLGILDNFRNIILLLENCDMLLNNDSKDFMIDNYTGKYKILIKKCHKLINSYCFDRPFSTDMRPVIELFDELKKNVNDTFQRVFELDLNYIYVKGFNRLREIDNYFENYIAMENALKKCSKGITGEIDLFVIMYGSLELGEIIYNNKFIKNKINLHYIFQDKGNYFEKQRNINKLKKYKTTNNITLDNPVILVDDNIFSGVTMQFAINDLIRKGFKNIKGIIAVKLVDLNRISQLKYYGNYLDLSLIDKLIFGCTSPTNYTKIKDNTNLDNRFVNELYLYSIQSEIFLKALYINNSFIKNSDTDIFLGFSKGKEIV